MLGWLVTTRLGRALGTVLATFGALVAAWVAGRRSRSTEIERVRLERYRATMRRMDDTDIGTGDTAADRKWLRIRAKRRRGL